jgi:hypothetical protein
MFTPLPTQGQPGRAAEGLVWSESVPSVGAVSTDAASIGISALAAVLLIVLMGFIGELFNNTVETNYDRMRGWWRKTWLGRIGRGFSAMEKGGSK